MLAWHLASGNIVGHKSKAVDSASLLAGYGRNGMSICAQLVSVISSLLDWIFRVCTLHLLITIFIVLNPYLLIDKQCSGR